jgi:hypothetical protein
MTHEARIAGKTVQVEVLAWRTQSAMARRLDTWAIAIVPRELVT